MSLHFTPHASVVYGFHIFSCVSSPKEVRRFWCGWSSSLITSCTPVGGGGKDALHYTPVSVLQTRGRELMCGVCVCTSPTEHPTPPHTLICMVCSRFPVVVLKQWGPPQLCRSTHHLRGHHTHYRVTSSACTCQTWKYGQSWSRSGKNYWPSVGSHAHAHDSI